ncbi:FAD-binding oxidoreductase [Streptomyces sp. CNQ085]|uniref:FAD-binding oxidoreductase n=1 Tax=Streptomyces sp. CNQ085 TaxID=2886944 RepID=UPI001F50A424|nr:FAD-dependent oxidoreductase [Streptomyces sp. CNQ085]MCI0384730.1 FAD-dependent oxidoreductase [Streptomyces sp. CNQ085]
MTTAGEHPVALARRGEAAYRAATRVFNLSAPVAPAVAVTARSAEEIRAAIDHARTAGLGVRVHATGHAAATARPMDHALLIRTELAEEVVVDPQRGIARVPAGTRWGAVVEAAAPHGLAAPHGSSPTVGAVGYLLGGGLSMYARHTGLAANSVRAVELVTADGELRRVDATHDPELFHALRGGGGGLGVVTAVEVALFPVAGVVTGAAFWPAANAERLLPIWRAWTARAPREVTTSVRVMNLPSLPEVPAVLRAGPVVCLDGVVIAPGTEDLDTARRQAADLLGPLRAATAPLMDTWHEAGPLAVPETHMDPPEPVPVLGDHLLLGELGDEGVAAFLRATVDRPRSALTVAELRQLGGSLAEAPAGSGALGRLDAHFAYSGAGVPGFGGTEEEIRAHCAEVRTHLGPWDTGRTAPTFVAGLEQPQGHLTSETVLAVDRVRARVDPEGLFRGDIAPGCSAA